MNSGTEANETAMKIAIQHFQERGIQGKHKILSRWMSYHGITMGALSMSGHPLRRQRFVSILEDYPTIRLHTVLDVLYKRYIQHVNFLVRLN